MNEKQELLEIYKLHSELADRVGQRREGANKLYVSLLTGLLLVLIVSLRYGSNNIPIKPTFLLFGVLGIALSVSWVIVIRSYRQLNEGKFKALHEIEKKLVYPFFKREWEFLERGEKRSKYWKLTTVEKFLPVVFILLSLVVMGCALYAERIVD